MIFEADTDALIYAARSMEETGTTLNTTVLARLRDLESAIRSSMGDVGNDIARKLDAHTQELESESLSLLAIADVLSQIGTTYERCEEDVALAHRQMATYGQNDTRDPQQGVQSTGSPSARAAPQRASEPIGRLAMEPQMFREAQNPAVHATIEDLFGRMF